MKKLGDGRGILQMWLQKMEALLKGLNFAALHWQKYGPHVSGKFQARCKTIDIWSKERNVEWKNYKICNVKKISYHVKTGFLFFTERMFYSSCEGLIKQPLDKLKRGLAIRFQGEEGMVSGGAGKACWHSCLFQCQIKLASSQQTWKLYWVFHFFSLFSGFWCGERVVWRSVPRNP